MGKHNKMAITITTDLIYIYMVLIFISGYFMFNVKKDFSMDDLLNYFIYITTKVMSYVIFTTSILLFIGVITGISETKINLFSQDILYILVFYSVINYGVYYLLKLINYYVDIYKKSDLMNVSLEKKEGVKK